ncbi:hypothetical protein D2A34_05220 [Clostridium chromiireducens]|uniref:Uncharacterized protein n=1 Tax=Clostridium chromiireducens TaxID=225345 RepID=A0A399IUS8_9CLOT|nr:hypothetical protein [Clostridium chromiireducens]RII36784.1 hypothetical protein D2A34_05220 [Clostridium chromiireducens]
MDNSNILEKIKNINIIISQIMKYGQIEYLNVFDESGSITLKYSKCDLHNLIYKKKQLKKELENSSNILTVVANKK